VGASRKASEKRDLGKNPFAKKAAGKGVTPVINVTPLVDVVLVLLIIFMVVLPAVQGAKTIEMVEVADADETKDDGASEPLTLTVALENGEDVFTYGEDDLPRADAIAKLAADVQADPSQRVLLRIDAKVKHKTVRALVKDVRDAGVPALSFAVAGKKDEWSGEEPPPGEGAGRGASH
jgi:biopolymer transport protein TolR